MPPPWRNFHVNLLGKNGPLPVVVVMTSICPARLAPWLCLALFAAAALSCQSPGLAAEAGLRRFDVPAGLADQTLKTFSDQAGVAVVFGTDSAGRIRTNAVKGNYTTAEAMALLLRDSGLIAVASEKTGTFTITRDPNGARATPAATGARPDAKPRPEQEGVVTLSPFVVDSSRETGYLATETLNGTRIRTEVKDIASSMTIFTTEMMDDLGAHNLNDLMMFAPNTDPFVVSTDQTTNYGATFILTANQYTTRGGSTTLVTQDFFTNNVPQDRYNSEALTFTRGPNSILFGQGDSAGGFTSSTKRANDKTATTVTLEGSSYDGFRATLDHNQVIRRGLLSIRYAGLHEQGHSYRYPSEKLQRRHFVTLSLRPTGKTEIRASFERGHLDLPAVKPWGIYDAISPWLDAGSPLLPTYVNSTGGKPIGTRNYTVSGLVSTEFSPAGTKIPIQYLTNQGQSAPATYAFGYPDWFTKRTFNDDSVYPVFSTLDGGSYRVTDYNIRTLVVEQEITKNLIIEAAVQENDTRVRANYGFVADNGYLHADPNAQLPGGIPNPNVGKLYAESLMTTFILPESLRGRRIMASYDLDLTRKQGWLKHLGRQRGIAFVEEKDTRSSTANMRAYNVTPLVTTGAFGIINNNRNLIYYRYYYDPARGKVGADGGRYLDNYPLVYANSPLPARDHSGVTTGLINIAASASESVLTTRGAALQSIFLNNRLVFTNGIRRDESEVWQAAAQDMTALADANGIRPDGREINVRRDFANSLREAGGSTYTRGAVFHVLPWLSLKYNASDNLRPNLGSRDVYGVLLPNSQGKGSDYGLRAALFAQKLLVDLTFYKLSNVNQFDPVNNSPTGHFGNEINYIWDAVASYSGDNRYANAPYSQTGQGWFDTASTSSEGIEFTVTANPNRQWRVSLNGSKRGNIKTTSRGGIIARYLMQYLPAIESRPEWMALNTVAGQTVAQRVANLQAMLESFDAIKDVPAAVYAPSWTLNAVQTYSFSAASRLKGLSVGTSMNARGQAIAGFREDYSRPKNLLDPRRPYYSPAYTIFGAWITYRHTAFQDRTDWRWQFNVRNLFDQGSIYPMRIVDSRDGSHTPSKAIYAFREPRTLTLSTTIKF